MKQQWDELVKSALLGTEKFALHKPALPEEIIEILVQTENTNINAEISFLQSASLLMNYKNAGTGFPVNHVVTPAAAEAEVLEVCNSNASKLLGIILDENDPQLNWTWLSLCAEKNCRIPEVYLPTLLNIGFNNPVFRENLGKTTGKRAKWLAQFNPEWEYLIKSPEESWDFGKPAERKIILQQIRKNDPSYARKLLEQSWKEENSKNKEEFLAILLNNLSDKDADFLQPLLKEKSKGVKAAAWQLLLRIPGSEIADQLWERTKEWLQVKKQNHCSF